LQALLHTSIDVVNMLGMEHPSSTTNENTKHLLEFISGLGPNRS